MRNVLIIAISLLLFLGLIPQKSFAHFTATDGDMTATLHVDPNDDPTPGQQANLYFLFAYNGKPFDVSTCNCTVTISEQGKQLSKQSLIQKGYTKPSIWGMNIPYVFPQSDVYHILLAGKPKTVNAFQPFTISWDFRVDPNGADAGIVIQRPSDIPMILAFVGGIVIFCTVIGFFIKKEIIDAEEVDNATKSKYNKKR